MHKLVLLRHGETVWNRENRFTGWTDVDLNETGWREARAAGQLLREEGFAFDVAFTSVLKRAIRTLWLVLEEMDRMWIPVEHSWRLNERHYGALQGLNKAETAAKFGDAQVKIWRRAYDTAPPPLEDGDPAPGDDNPRYADLAPGEFPKTECLKDTVARFLPYWHEHDRARSCAAASGSSSPPTATACARWSSISTTCPTTTSSSSISRPGSRWSTSWTTSCRPIRHYYLGDPEAIAAAMQAVANQGKARSN